MTDNNQDHCRHWHTLALRHRAECLTYDLSCSLPNRSEHFSRACRLFSDRLRHPARAQRICLSSDNRRDHPRAGTIFSAPKTYRANHTRPHPSSEPRPSRIHSTMRSNCPRKVIGPFRNEAQLFAWHYIASRLERSRSRITNNSRPNAWERQSSGFESMHPHRLDCTDLTQRSNAVEANSDRFRVSKITKYCSEIAIRRDWSGSKSAASYEAWTTLGRVDARVMPSRVGSRNARYYRTANEDAASNGLLLFCAVARGQARSGAAEIQQTSAIGHHRQKP